MIFDYNIFTGLNYYTCEEEILFIEISSIPLNKSMEEFIEEWRQTVKERFVAWRSTAFHKC